MAHPLDEYEPTPEDVAGVLSKAFAEKAQTIRRLRKIIAGLRDELKLARAAIAGLDRDALGIGGDGVTHWSIRDELVAKLDAAIGKGEAT